MAFKTWLSFNLKLRMSNEKNNLNDTEVVLL